MHEQVVEVAFGRSDVFVGREPGDALLVDENPERVDPIDEGVDPEVELEPVYKVRLVHVPLGHVLLPGLQIHVLVFADQKYAPTLAQIHWLNDKGLHLLLRYVLKLSSKVCRFLGQDPGFRKNIVIVFKNPLHPL